MEGLELTFLSGDIITADNPDGNSSFRVARVQQANLVLHIQHAFAWTRLRLRSMIRLFRHVCPWMLHTDVLHRPEFSVIASIDGYDTEACCCPVEKPGMRTLNVYYG